MTWQVLWTEPAIGDMRRLDRKVARRVRNALLRLAETGHGDVKQLAGKAGELRLRVGDWRVRFSFRYSTKTIEVLRVLPRAEAYRE